MGIRSAPPDEPALLDEQALARLHDEFASTDDLDELASLIGNFLARGAEQVKAIRNAAERGDCGALRAAGHRLKGSSGTLGASLAGAVAARVEAAAAAGDLAAARLAFRELEVVFSMTREALAERLEALGSPMPDSASRSARTS